MKEELKLINSLFLEGSLVARAKYVLDGAWDYVSQYRESKTELAMSILQKNGIFPIFNHIEGTFYISDGEGHE